MTVVLGNPIDHGSQNIKTFANNLLKKTTCFLLFSNENCQFFLFYLKKWGWRFLSSIIFQNLATGSPLILIFREEPELEVASKLNTCEQVIVQCAIFVKTTLGGHLANTKVL